MAQRSLQAFNAKGNTIVVLSSNAPVTGKQAPIFATLAPYNEKGQYRIVNINNDPIFVGIGDTAAQAQAAAANPTSATSQPCFVIRADSEKIITANIGSFFSAFSNNSFNLYITPGEGI